MTRRRKAWLRRHRDVEGLLANLEDKVKSLGVSGTPLVWAEDNATDPDGSPMELASHAVGAIVGVAALVENLRQRVIMRGNPRA